MLTPSSHEDKAVGVMVSTHSLTFLGMKRQLLVYLFIFWCEDAVAPSLDVRQWLLTLFGKRNLTRVLEYNPAVQVEHEQQHGEPI